MKIIIILLVLVAGYFGYDHYQTKQAKKQQAELRDKIRHELKVSDILKPDVTELQKYLPYAVVLNSLNYPQYKVVIQTKLTPYQQQILDDDNQRILSKMSFAFHEDMSCHTIIRRMENRSKDEKQAFVYVLQADNVQTVLQIKDGAGKILLDTTVNLGSCSQFYLLGNMMFNNNKVELR